MIKYYYIDMEYPSKPKNKALRAMAKYLKDYFKGSAISTDAAKKDIEDAIQYLRCRFPKEIPDARDPKTMGNEIHYCIDNDIVIKLKPIVSFIPLLSFPDITNPY